LSLFEVKVNALEGGRTIRHRLFTGNSPISYGKFIDLLSNEKTFRQEFNAQLASSKLNSYRFETPPLDSNTQNLPFEFVLIDSPGLCRATTDAKTFAQYFIGDEPIVTFKSLGADATLIVPSPTTSIDSDQDCYKHLANFVRSAPAEQIDALWKRVGIELQNNNGSIWFNTEGSGVAWLHIRLDSRPKYYGYAPYRTIGSSRVPE